ncbi:hypothetical protein GCM10020000_83850 [Streptomyces olivoverticillatus]
MVTLTETDPGAAPVGTVTVSWLSEITVGVAEFAPKVTAVAVDSPVPLMVTVLPPAVGPEAGLSEALNGAPM